MFNKRIPFLTERFRYTRITGAQRTVFHFSRFEGGGEIFIYIVLKLARPSPGDAHYSVSRGCGDGENQAISCIFESTDST